MRRILLVLLLAAAALVAPSLPHAKACSCAVYDVRERLPEAAGAFVGTLISRDDPQPAGNVFSSATLVRYRFEVERAVKGDIPSGTIDVWSSGSGASCGLETPVGRRTGLLLRHEDGRWLSGLCEQADPDVLIRAGQPLPPPTGKAPPAVLVGTTHGPGRMVSLDGLGRVMAYGGGDGIATDIAFCPGAGRVAESYSPPYGTPSPGPGIAVRTSDGLDVVWERLLGDDGGPDGASIADVACLDRDGGTVVVLALRHTYSETSTRHRALILAYGRQGEADVLWQGEATTGTLSADGRTAYLNGGNDGSDLQVVELSDPAGPSARSLGRLPDGTGALTISPDGRRLAGVTTHEFWSGPTTPPASAAVMVDLAASPAGVTEAGLASSYGHYGTALWVGTDRVGFVPRWDGNPVRLFDTTLHETGRWDGWSASAVTVVGDRLVGLDGPRVETAPVASGPATGWADLESGVPGAIAAFPGGAAIGSAGSTTTTTTSAPAKPAGASGTSTSAPAPTTTSPTGDPASTSPPPTAPEGAASGDVVALAAPNSGAG
ncbi:MAG TPA: hypothetical protein VFF24_04595, partial [Acidimicrobiia bacterium]|nr:hypothetical protein [Acidimicrobiia bacterium]